MAVSKITTPISDLDEIDKINEIIDNLGGGGSSYTAGTGIDITSNTISVTSPTLTNTGSHTNSLAIGKSSISTWTGDIIITTPDSSFSGASCGGAISVGKNASHSSGSFNSLSIGFNSSVSGNAAIALGGNSHATAAYAIQIGYGTNSEVNSFYVGTSTSNNWKMLDSAGLIPDARLSSNIARVGDNSYSADCPALTAVSGVCTWTVTHTLATKDVTIRVYEVSTGNTVVVNSSTTATDTVVISILSASDIAAGTYRVVLTK